MSHNLSIIIAALALVPQMGYALDQDVVQGFRLFTEETFSGNGRTCGTCHRPESGFTVSPADIASLPADDPMFVHETVPELSELENSVLLRQLAIFNTDANGPFRSANHLSAMASPHGWAGTVPDLFDFAIGAVRQHATKTLSRTEGVDFRSPTDNELGQMLLFQETVSGFDELADLSAVTFLDSNAEQGRRMYVGAPGVPNAKCQDCHSDGGAFDTNGVNSSFVTNTNVLARRIRTATGITLPQDPGDSTGTQAFNTSAILADTAPFFHNHGSAAIENAVGFYTNAQSAFQRSPAGVDIGGIRLSRTQSDQVAVMLRVYTAWRRAGQAIRWAEAAQDGDGAGSDWQMIASATTALGIRVLQERNLMPEVQNALASSRVEIDSGDFSNAVLGLEAARTMMLN